MTDSKVALVTGGSRGLGRDIALSLAGKGISVAITYNTRKDEADAVVAQIKSAGVQAAALQLDTSAVSSFDAFYNQLAQTLQQYFSTDKFDFLVNNAGIGIYAPFEDTTEEQFDALSGIHLKGVFFLTQKGLKHMADGGAIINIATGLTRFNYPGYSAYAAMKGAVETLTKYLAKELGGRGIRVNAVAPGAIETDFAGGSVRDNAEINKHIAAATALGRAGKPEDIGGVVALLCSAEAGWINAQRIEVSGGQAL